MREIIFYNYLYKKLVCIKCMLYLLILMLYGDIHINLCILLIEDSRDTKRVSEKPALDNLFDCCEKGV